MRVIRLIPPRVRIVCVLAILPLLGHALGRFYAPALVRYVVEETLVQKAPPGMNTRLVRSRLAAALAACPDRHERLGLLLDISQSLEKYQRLSREDMNRLVPGGNVAISVPD